MRVVTLCIVILLTDGWDLVHARFTELLLAHALAQHRVPALHVLGAVGRLGGGAELRCQFSAS